MTGGASKTGAYLKVMTLANERPSCWCMRTSCLYTPIGVEPVARPSTHGLPDDGTTLHTYHTIVTSTLCIDGADGAGDQISHVLARLVGIVEDVRVVHSHMLFVCMLQIEVQCCIQMIVSLNNVGKPSDGRHDLHRTRQAQNPPVTRLGQRQWHRACSVPDTPGKAAKGHHSVTVPPGCDAG